MESHQTKKTTAEKTTISEIRTAKHKLKNDKFPESDQIAAELLKEGKAALLNTKKMS